MAGKGFKKIWWQIKLFFARLFLGNPASKLTIVGVTGTNGKTTTTTLLYQVAKGLGYKVGLIGTVNILINDREYKVAGRVPSTTPDSITLTKIFKEMVKEGCTHVFMEVSSHAIDQNRIEGIKFAGGVFTNITHDHLDYHGSFGNYFLAKRKFFTSLSKSAFALSNDDDPQGEAMIANIDGQQYFYGFSNTSDFYAQILKMNFEGLELQINRHKVTSKLLGKFNAYNLLAAWGTCSLLGFDMDNVRDVIANVTPPSGRFEYLKSSSGVLAVVDYAHSPDALEKIIDAVKEVKPKDGKLITVFGCGGDRDPSKRSKMGKLGASMSDIAIFTSDNPRGEDPNKILEDMKKELTKEELEKVKTIVSRREAIKEAASVANSGDTIILAGKGHEDYQEIKGIKSHFSDIEELKRIYEL